MDIEEERKKLKKNKTIFIAFLVINISIIIAFICHCIYENEMKKYEDLSSTDKPIIYLYPTEESNISVELENPNQITCSYPKYIDGWNVKAQPNGDLKDLDTENDLYALYYEAENKYDYKIEEDGFVVKGEDTADFLEKELAILGLTPREAEEFIVYWLPKLEANKYNYIRFATEEEIGNNMPLEITPTPDTLIRVVMTFKGLEKPIEVKKQILTSPIRDGFVAVEWGRNRDKIKER